MFRKRRALICFALLALAAAAPALASEPYAIPDTEVVAMPTAANGIDYELYVRASPDCAVSRPCPTIYFLDAEYSFGLAALVAEHLEDRDQLQPLIIVSIAYRDKNQYRLNRSRDYTPVHHPTDGYGPRYQAESGGGPAFLNVIENEIIPLVEDRFHASTARRGLGGHSFGGLFASWTLLTRPDLFQRYLIVSPSLWYADKTLIPGLLAQPDLPDFQPDTRAYMGVGAFEEQPIRGRAMVSDLRRLHRALSARDDAGFEARMRVFEDETHASVFPTVLSSGLRALYPVSERD